MKKEEVCFAINVKGEDVRAIITDYGDEVGVTAAIWTNVRPVIDAEDILRTLGRHIDERIDKMKSMLVNANYWEVAGLQPTTQDLEFWAWKLNQVSKQNVYYEIIDVSR